MRLDRDRAPTLGILRGSSDRGERQRLEGSVCLSGLVEGVQVVSFPLAVGLAERESDIVALHRGSA